MSKSTDIAYKLGWLTARISYLIFAIPCFIIGMTAGYFAMLLLAGFFAGGGIIEQGRKKKP